MWPMHCQIARRRALSAGGGTGVSCWSLLALLCWLRRCWCRAEETLEVGFAHADITPDVRADAPVWLAGYYPGRAATGVHDPLYARCVVLRSGTQKLAWVSVDLIGLQFPDVQRLRERCRISAMCWSPARTITKDRT